MDARRPWSAVLVGRTQSPIPAQKDFDSLPERSDRCIRASTIWRPGDRTQHLEIRPRRVFDAIERCRAVRDSAVGDITAEEGVRAFIDARRTSPPLFTGWRASGLRIYTIRYRRDRDCQNSDGTNPLKMTSMGRPQCSNPQWSPDGERIVFNSRRRARPIVRPSAGHRPDSSKNERSRGRNRTSLVSRRAMDLLRVEQDGPSRSLANAGPGGVPTQITRQGGYDGHRISGRKLPLLRERYPIADDDLACAGWWRHGNRERGSLELFE